MAYFKPLPKPEQDKRMRYLARADGIIKPMQLIQYAQCYWNLDEHVPYYELVVAFDGVDFRRIMGMYIRRWGQRTDGSEPPVDAVKDDIIEYIPVSYN